MTASYTLAMMSPHIDLHQDVRHLHLGNVRAEVSSSHLSCVTPAGTELTDLSTYSNAVMNVHLAGSTIASVMSSMSTNDATGSNYVN